MPPIAPTSNPSPPRRVGEDASDSGPEAFGQAGVRQFIAPIIRWLCIVGCAASLAMWHRSTQLADELAFRRVDQQFSIASISGHLRVHSVQYDARRWGDVGWLYRHRPLSRRTADWWPSSIFKWVGIEMSFNPLDPTATTGFWLRIQWYFAAALFAAVPVGQWLLQRRRRGIDDAQ